VTIVEFGDFECPPCGMMYPQTEAVLKNYAGRVRLVYRHFPLRYTRMRSGRPRLPSPPAPGILAIYRPALRGNRRRSATLPSGRTRPSGLSAGRFDRDLDSEAAAVRVVHDMRLGRRTAPGGRRRSSSTGSCCAPSPSRKRSKRPYGERFPGETRALIAVRHPPFAGKEANAMSGKTFEIVPPAGPAPVRAARDHRARALRAES
jgi:hypothetical protein